MPQRNIPKAYDRRLDGANPTSRWAAFIALLLLSLSAWATPGDLDRSFNSSQGFVTKAVGPFADYGSAVAVQTDGKIVVAGYGSNGNDFDFALLRYNTDGTLDTTFDGDGVVTTAIGFEAADRAFGLAIQSDGKIVVAGYVGAVTHWDIGVVRYQTNGALDTTFGTGGVLTTDFGSQQRNDFGLALALQSDGKIVVAGYRDNGTDFDFLLVRCTDAGVLDAGFGSGGMVSTDVAGGGGNDGAYAVAIDGDGKILVAGQRFSSGNSDFAILRYNSDGTLDTSFDTDGIVTTPIGAGYDEADGIVVQTNGKILVVGSSDSGGRYDFALARYNTDGSLDTGFDTDGIVTTAIGANQGYGYAPVVQSDGKILVAGYSNQGVGHDITLVRYNADGSLDTGFDGDTGAGNGKVTTAIGAGDDRARGIALQSDGKILVVGYAFDGSDYNIALVRYSINYDPAFTSSAGTSVNEDSAYSYSITTSDVEAGTLTITAPTLPGWLSLVDNGDRTATLTGTPTNDYVGANAVTLRVSDGTDTIDQSFTIAVANTNDAPTLSSTAVTTVAEDSLYNYTLVGVDVDVGDALTLTAPVLPAWLTFNGATGVLSGTPTNDEVGSHNVTLRVSDGDVDVDQTFTITVANTNDLSVISTTPALAVNEDSPYIYTLAASDVDVGDVLAFSAPTLPGWLSFNPSTGVLTGTPTNDYVGSNAVTLRVYDGTANVDQSFVITVNNTNDPPTDIVLSGGIAENTDTAAPVTVGTLSAADVDVGDAHSYAITGGADAANFQLAGAALQVNAGVVLDYETKSSYEVEITTQDASSVIFVKTLTVAVVNVNEAPVISSIGDQTLDINGVSSALAVTVSDVDHAASSLVLSASSADNALIPPGDVSFDGSDNNRTVTIAAGMLQYGTTAVTVTVSDGGGLTASTTFNVVVTGVDSDGDTVPDLVDTDDDNDGMSDVFEVAYGLDSLDGSDAALDTDSDGLTNLQEYQANLNPNTDDNPPVVTPPADLVVSATGLYTRVALGTASAVDIVDGALTPSPSFSGLFDTGTHVITWSATDVAGNTGTATQNITVIPLIDFAPDQISGEGNVVTVRVRLNGFAPVYPVIVPFTVGGTAANPGDHDLVNGAITIAGGLEGEVTFTVSDDSAVEGSDESAILTMGSPTGAAVGQHGSHTVTIVEHNVAPRVVLSMVQAGRATSMVTTGGGPVIVTATVFDPNPGGTHRYSWQDTDNSLVDRDVVPHTFTFDPNGLRAGVYSARVAATDTGSPALAGSADLAFYVTDSAPSLSLSADGDGDGVSDSAEGYGDADADRVPDYLDAIDASNVIQGNGGANESYLLESEPGLSLRLGQVAVAAQSQGAAVSAAAIAAHSEAFRFSDSVSNVGGYFDFEIAGLPEPGSSVQVVLPQQAAIPAGAVYRKLMSSGWQGFVENGANAIASAAGEAGYCPPPGDSRYSAGLTAGNWCVQLTIQDGGPNDSDGAADGVIKDPGGVGVLAADGGGGGGGAYAYGELLSIALALVLLSSKRRRFRGR